MAYSIPTIHVDVINESTVCTDAEIKHIMTNLQVQVSKHFFPAWGVDAYLTFIPRGGTPYTDHWWLSVLDDSDQAGALGYHDVTNAGLPLGKVFAKTDKTFGYLVSVTMSHELLEMLVDPHINLTAQMNDGNFYAYEVADACEADSLGYKINDVVVSDFVWPAWFEGQITPGTRMDQMNHLAGPCPVLAPGGYIGYYDPRTGQWNQSTLRKGATERYLARPKVGSRRERRTIAIPDRIASTVKR